MVGWLGALVLSMGEAGQVAAFGLLITATIGGRRMSSRHDPRKVVASSGRVPRSAGSA